MRKEDQEAAEVNVLNDLWSGKNVRVWVVLNSNLSSMELGFLGYKFSLCLTDFDQRFIIGR